MTVGAGYHSETRVRRARDCEHPYLPDEPSGYLAWHDWAEEKAKTHVQKQCPKCGLWVIYEPLQSCDQCGRKGTRGFRTVPSDHEGPTDGVHSFTVCSAGAACRKRCREAAYPDD